jgi:hypothetical protein
LTQKHDVTSLQPPSQRIAEASALRRFFQEQWDHFQQLLEQHHQQAAQDRALEQAVETIVDGTDKRLRSLYGYQKRLREGARQLLNYVEGLVNKLPQPLLISHRNLVMDPLVRRLIRTPQQLQALFIENPAIRDFFYDPVNEERQEVYALMFFIYQQQQRFGAELHGNIIMQDVRQTLVSFVAPEVVAPRATEDDIRSATKEMLFESAIAHVKLQLIRQRAEHLERPDLARLELNRNLSNPEVYFEHLIRLLARPGELLDIHESQLRISTMGVQLPIQDTDQTNTLRLQQLAVGEEPVRIMSMVRFPRIECGV